MKLLLAVSLTWLSASVALAGDNATKPDGQTSRAGARIEVAIPAPSQQPSSTAANITGVWTLHSIYEEDDDGDDIAQFDDDPKGQLSFDGNGRFSFAIIGYDLKFKSGNRVRGSRFENDAATKLNLFYYGTYQLNAAGNEVKLTIERSSFPNWNGQVRTATFAVDGGKLDIRSGSSISSLTGAGCSHTVWMRMK